LVQKSFEMVEVSVVSHIHTRQILSYYLKFDKNPIFMYIMISYLLFILQFSTWLQYEPMEKASNEE